MFLLAGLGNPGARYEKTRHNIGWLVLDEVARRHNIAAWKKAHEASIATGALASGEKFMLAKPLTFMNLSGRAVSALLRYHRIERAHLLVLTDDLNLPLGRLRVRAGGSDGGHNGLKSITQMLGGSEYSRLRIGVGAPSEEERKQRGTADFVLSTFSPEERAGADAMIARAADCVELFVSAGVEAAMNRFNAAAS